MTFMRMIGRRKMHSENVSAKIHHLMAAIAVVASAARTVMLAVILAIAAALKDATRKEKNDFEAFSVQVETRMIVLFTL